MPFSQGRGETPIVQRRDTEAGRETLRPQPAPEMLALAFCMFVCLLACFWERGLDYCKVNILGWGVKGAGKLGVYYATLLERTLLEVF